MNSILEERNNDIRYRNPLDVEGSIRVYSGQYVNVFDPKPETLLISDIAHALSMLPRFAAHTLFPYPVSRHCTWVADRIIELGGTREEAYAGLMHDASEAFLIDLCKPIKLKMSIYNETESNLSRVLAAKFGFRYPYPEIVNRVDREALEWEWENIVLRLPSHPPNEESRIESRDRFLTYHTLLSLK